MNSRPPLSALFIDFDNVFSCLRAHDAKAAESFACHPEKWFGWLTEQLEKDGRKRHITVRRCYLNPSAHGQWRKAFMACGFEIIDCPALTGAGKNSADLRIAVDMLELLEFKVPYGEFVLLSADADFTPVLMKLRKHGCQTAVLAVGDSSAIYRASCDRVIDQSQFLTVALDAPAQAKKVALKKGNFPAKPSNVKTSTPPVVARKTPVPKMPVVVAPKKSPGAPVATLTLSEDEVQVVSRLVVQHVCAAPMPVALSALAKWVRDARPDVGDNWAGCKTFKNFRSKLDLSRLSVSSVSGGYLYDPNIHLPPVGSKSAGEKQAEPE